MASYYDSNKATLANAKEFCLENMGEQHFPTEGLYLGKLSGGAMEVPALFDLDEGKGLCFLYDSNQNRERVNLLFGTHSLARGIDRPFPSLRHDSLQWRYPGR